MRSAVIAVLGLMVAVVTAPAYAEANPKATHTPKHSETPTWSPPSYGPNDFVEHIEAYDVKLQVRRDGSMHVTETIQYNFGDGPYPDLVSGSHHGIIRKISTHRRVDDRRDRVIQIRDPQVHGDGIGPADLAVSRSGNDEVLKVGNPEATVSGVKTYVIDYDVPRALVPRSGGTDELYWDAIGTRWTVPISKASVTVTAPVDIASAGCYRGFEDDTSSCSRATTGTTLKAAENGLSKGEGITLQVELPQAGMASVVPPPLVRRPVPFALTVAAGVLVLAAVGIVAGFAWLCMARPVRRRPATAAAALDAAEAAGPVDSPPAGMSPGLAGLLRNEGSVGARQVNAILIDLATRGYLRFEETKVSKKEIGRKLVRGERPADDLDPYEAKVIDIVIGSEGSFARRDEITVSTLRKRGWDQWKAVGELLEKEACRRGWFRWPLAVQHVFASWLVVALVIVGGMLLLGVTSGGVGGVPTAGFGWGALAFLAAAVAVGVIGRQRARTAAGARATAEAHAYADAVRTWTIGPRDPEADAALVSLVFPYAVTFGQASGFGPDWGKVFEDLDDELPWYVPANGASGEAATRIKTLADIIEEPRPRLPAPVRRSSRPSSSRRSGYRSYNSYDTYSSSSWTSSSSSGGWSSGGGSSGDSGGGSVGGGDGGGGGGSW